MMNRLLHQPKFVVSRPHGAALLSAMVLLGLVATLTVGISWVGYSAISRLENQRDAGQAELLAHALIDYGRWMLIADSRASAGASSLYDHPSEPWAQFVPETRVTALFPDLLSAEDQARADQTVISGGLTDEQGRFNLESLLAARESGESAEAQFRRLLRLQGILPDEANRISDAVQEFLKRTAIDPAGHRRLHQGSGELAWVGLQRDLIPSLALNEGQRAALLGQLTILPGQTALNVNTANLVTLQAVLGDESGEVSRRIVAMRDRLPLRTTSEIAALLAPGQVIPNGQLDTKSLYFRASGSVRFGRSERAFIALLQREPSRVRTLEITEPW